ncbi:MAG: rod shape-determining protein MreC [Candidatus Marinimicrobia bacterium]|nr:rod shape-determining protein MreC [Candidatus Neomarinimicrobiota bacterium]MBL7023107.1 rod shape-determining protein MreC [Candidatus Neomarinimicrobiota bacterium]MBL7109127.1 rod shape-determining protein MreC [Candidatus Neomarinimicrobiota bacterium]
MKLSSFGYPTKDSIALFIAIVVSLILFFSNSSVRVREVQADVSDIINIVLSPQKWYKDILNVKKQNQILTETVTQLTLLNQQLLHYEFENKQLREMLNFSEDIPLSLKPANVVNHHFASSVQSITIDVGKNDQLVQNLAVIDLKGLLGKTISIGENASTVQLISDKNFRVSVRVGESRILGIFHPTQGEYGVISGIPKSANISIGSKVVTSGISDIYPSNIPVAEVIAINIEDVEVFQNVVVKLSATLHNLGYVFVIQ